MTDQHTPWCDHAHPETDDGTGATPCFSRPVVLWPGTTAWLRTATYPDDAPAVIVDNRDGTQSTWLLAEFRQMLWAGIELCATANLGTWPTPDPGPIAHVFDSTVMDAVKTSDRGVESREEFEGRGGVLLSGPAVYAAYVARSTARLAELAAIQDRFQAEQAAAAIPTVIDNEPPAQARVCTCSFLPDPHIWGASCPMTGHL